MAKKGSSKCDPGWNDPPIFSYESQVRASKPRTLLNKRVSFPLNEASPPTSSSLMPVDPTAPLPSCNISTLPPPPSISSIVSKESPVLVKGSEDSDDVFNSLQALETVMTNLGVVLNAKFDNEEKDKVEIQRRLDAMKKMWIDNKLCSDIQRKLLELSLALKNEETEKANELQKGLMVDHSQACSLWMSAVRQLIHHRESDTSDPVADN